MSGSAAFFDLDRTLLSGASGEVVSHALRSAGVVTRDIPGESLVYKLFSVFGENLPSMALGRQAVHAFKDGIVSNAAAKKLEIPKWSFIEN